MIGGLGFGEVLPEVPGSQFPKKKMESTIGFRVQGYIGIMEKRIETTIQCIGFI